MRRRFLIFCLLAVLVVGAVTAWHYRARLFPQGEVSALFLRYEHQPGIEADFIKNYRLNDSTAVDVTVLKATDSVAWGNLVQDFCLDYIDSSIVEDVRKNKNSITIKLFPKGHPCEDPDSLMADNSLMVCSFTLHEMSIFDLKGNESLSSIITYKFHNNKETILTHKK